MLELYSASGTRKCEVTTHYYTLSTTTNIDKKNIITTNTERMVHNPAQIDCTCDYHINWRTNLDAVCSVYMGYETTGLELVESDIISVDFGNGYYYYAFSKSYHSYGYWCYKNKYRVECKVSSLDETEKTENIAFE